MNTEDKIWLCGAVVIAVVLVIGFVSELKQAEDCDLRGGVSIKTASGHVCVKLEKI